MKFRFISDSGHGWLEVPMALLRGLGIVNRISHYSYQKGPWAYLEEDCDFGVFHQKMQAEGMDYSFTEEYVDGDSQIRNYRRFA